MSKLDEIVNVKIEIASPAVDSVDFDHLLILGPPPADASVDDLPKVGAYTDIQEVAAAGYVNIGDNADPVGAAARIAFSQNPRPDRIYIAAQKRNKPLASDASLAVITAANSLTAAVPVGTIDPVAADNLPWLQLTYNRAAVDSAEVVIEKDGVVVWGRKLPVSANPAAFLQVCIGDSPRAGEDQMNIPAADYAGTYTVELTAKSGDVSTVITRQVEFDGVSVFEEVAGSNVTIPELQSPLETLSEAINTTGWYVVCAAGIDESLYEPIAAITETQNKLFTYTFLTKDDPVGSIYLRSFGWCGLIHDNDAPEDVPEDSRYIHVGAAAKCLNYPVGAETWTFKQLTGLYPSEISTTQRKALTEGHSNFFSQYAGRNITMNGQVRYGEWIDVIRGRDWLQNDMQLRLFNLLLGRGKIPYTNPGIALVENQMLACLKEGIRRPVRH